MDYAPMRVGGMNAPTVAVLFARADSVYKTLPGCDVYDSDRDALTYAGELPVVAHPPCRLWGRLRHMSTAPASERELALWAVDTVRRCGGVLEHPWASTLWPAAGLPKPGTRDDWGGFTLDVDQHAWGHLARKRTWLYVVGCEPGDVPAVPLNLAPITHVVAAWNHGRRDRSRPWLTKAQNEGTPRDLAVWLCDLARLCARVAVLA